MADVVGFVPDQLMVGGVPTAKTTAATPAKKGRAKASICDVCGKAFASPSRLKQHVMVHTGEKPFQCSVCNTSFRSKCTLVTHMRTHTGEKPYECTECSNRFRTTTALKRHMRTHTGERPFKCQHCGQAFGRRSAMQVHERIHTREPKGTATVTSKPAAGKQKRQQQQQQQQPASPQQLPEHLQKQLLHQQLKLNQPQNQQQPQPMVVGPTATTATASSCSSQLGDELFTLPSLGTSSTGLDSFFEPSAMDSLWSDIAGDLDLGTAGLGTAGLGLGAPMGDMAGIQAPVLAPISPGAFTAAGVGPASPATSQSSGLEAPLHMGALAGLAVPDVYASSSPQGSEWASLPPHALSPGSFSALSPASSSSSGVTSAATGTSLAGLGDLAAPTPAAAAAANSKATNYDVDEDALCQLMQVQCGLLKEMGVIPQDAPCPPCDR